MCICKQKILKYKLQCCRGSVIPYQCSALSISKQHLFMAMCLCQYQIYTLFLSTVRSVVFLAVLLPLQACNFMIECTALK